MDLQAHTFTLTVGCENGLHMRPALAISEAIQQYAETIMILLHKQGGGSANAHSMLAILALGAPRGIELTLEVRNADHETANEIHGKIARCMGHVATAL